MELRTYSHTAQLLSAQKRNGMVCAILDQALCHRPREVLSLLETAQFILIITQFSAHFPQNSAVADCAETNNNGWPNIGRT
jgi:hypothetical protein